jgi:hypothetical protein
VSKSKRRRRLRTLHLKPMPLESDHLNLLAGKAR